MLRLSQHARTFSPPPPPGGETQVVKRSLWPLNTNLLNTQAMHIWICVCVCVCVYIYIYIYIRVCISLSLYLSISPSLYLSVYLSLSIYIYTHTRVPPCGVWSSARSPRPRCFFSVFYTFLFFRDLPLFSPRPTRELASTTFCNLSIFFLAPKVEETHKRNHSENTMSFKIPCCQRSVGLSAFSFMFGRASHKLPRVGSPKPQEKVLRPAGVRHLYKWNSYRGHTARPHPQ